MSYIDKVTEESIPTLPTGTCVFSGMAGQMPMKLAMKVVRAKIHARSTRRTGAEGRCVCECMCVCVCVCVCVCLLRAYVLYVCVCARTYASAHAFAGGVLHARTHTHTYKTQAHKHRGTCVRERACAFVCARLHPHACARLPAHARALTREADAHHDAQQAAHDRLEVDVRANLLVRRLPHACGGASC